MLDNETEGRDNLANTANTANTATLTTHTDAYLFGYADAIDNTINLQAFTKSKDYQQGYEDALHDCTFTVLTNDTHPAF